jgi:hypothetical protein
MLFGASRSHVLNLLLNLFKVEGSGRLARRIVFEGHQEPSRHLLNRNEHECTVKKPVVVCIAIMLRFFKWIPA